MVENIRKAGKWSARFKRGKGKEEEGKNFYITRLVS